MNSVEPHPDADSVYRIIVEQSPHLIARYDRYGTFLYVSPICQTLLGYTAEELHGRSLYDFVQQSDVDNLRQAYTTTLTRQGAQTAEYRVRRKDGSTIWLETTFQMMNFSNDEVRRDVLAFSRDATESKHVEAALEMLARGSAAVTSDDFFRPFVSHVAYTLRASYAFITEANEAHTRVRMLAFWKGDDFGVPFEYDLVDTPCDAVINQGKTCYYPVGVQAIFPRDKDLTGLGAQGYIGIPIYDSRQRIIGHLAVIDSKALKIKDRDRSLLRIFATRAGIELERLHALGVSAD
jgi:PAS domain S-box-containing protein